jgi:hypothetical protein
MSGKCDLVVELLYKMDEASVHLGVKDRHESVILTLVVIQSVTHLSLSGELHIQNLGVLLLTS